MFNPTFDAQDQMKAANFLMGRLTLWLLIPYPLHECFADMEAAEKQVEEERAAPDCQLNITIIRAPILTGGKNYKHDFLAEEKQYSLGNQWSLYPVLTAVLSCSSRQRLPDHRLHLHRPAGGGGRHAGLCGEPRRGREDAHSGEEPSLVGARAMYELPNLAKFCQEYRL